MFLLILLTEGRSQIIETELELDHLFGLASKLSKGLVQSSRKLIERCQLQAVAPHRSQCKYAFSQIKELDRVPITNSSKNVVS